MSEEKPVLSSWTITGASPETRDKIRKAAERDGMGIRAWVDATLNAAADDKPAAEARSLNKLIDKLDDISERLDAVEAHMADVNNRGNIFTANVMGQMAEVFGSAQAEAHKLSDPKKVAANAKRAHKERARERKLRKEQAELREAQKEADAS